MAIVGTLFFIIGLTLIILSRAKREKLFDFSLPEREVRRVWLPLGLIFITLSVLFVVMFTTTLPSSPLRQAETKQVETRQLQNTLSQHTVYFDAHTLVNQPTTAPRSSVNPMTLTAMGTTSYVGQTATALSLSFPTVTRVSGIVEKTIQAGDSIAFTATANVPTFEAQTEIFMQPFQTQDAIGTDYFVALTIENNSTQPPEITQTYYTDLLITQTRPIQTATAAMRRATSQAETATTIMRIQETATVQAEAMIGTVEARATDYVIALTLEPNFGTAKAQLYPYTGAATRTAESRDYDRFQLTATALVLEATVTQEAYYEDLLERPDDYLVIPSPTQQSFFIPTATPTPLP